MGIIAISTPNQDHQSQPSTVTRRQRIKVHELVKDKGVTHYTCSSMNQELFEKHLSNQGTEGSHYKNTNDFCCTKEAIKIAN